MKTSRYSEEQVTYALRSAESGTPVADVCRQIGAFYLWKKKYGVLGVPEVRELRQMWEENARLKRLVAGRGHGSSTRASGFCCGAKADATPRDASTASIASRGCRCVSERAARSA